MILAELQREAHAIAEDDEGTCHYCGAIGPVNEDSYCEMCMDDTCCPCCGMTKTKSARVCRPCWLAGFGNWPYQSDEL